MTSHGLIDTTEMYLKVMLEMEEDGILPLRARIVDRLGLRAPTVSQTVSRLERDGLLVVHADGHIALSARGRLEAVRVMRKHRLAEVLLFQLIGMEWRQVHVEACRWEHVMSEPVERRILDLCGRPRYCPHGNPIPGLRELGPPPGGAPDPEDALTPACPVAVAVLAGHTTAVINRISERVQDDVPFLHSLYTAGMLPGERVGLALRPGRGVELRTGDRTVLLDRHQAQTVLVTEN
jgi:DtxR family Mn-dependent transcriptional regulator